MMEKQEIKVYLGGYHLDNTGWREEFHRLAAVEQTGRVSIRGVDPFKRQIDELDNRAIIKHDLKILSDEELRFLVLKSLDHKGNLSTGTACEMMLAYFMNKRVVVLVEQTPESEQPWIHPFVERYADYITDSLVDVVQWIYDHQACHHQF